MQLNQRYQISVEKEGFNSEEAAETIHKEIENANVTKEHDDYFFISL
jgi:hypothetical protein